MALLALVAGIVVTMEAGAHHPGSHAERLDDGRVRLDASAVVRDTCTTIGAVALGAPRNVVVPAGGAAVLVRLIRKEGAACEAGVRSLNREVVLPIASETSKLHLYVVSSEDRLESTERLNLR